MRLPLHVRVGNIAMAGALMAAVQCAPTAGHRSSLRFEVSFPASLQPQPLDGRILLIVSQTADPEPRFQAGGWRENQSQPFFGIDVEALKPGAAAVLDAGVQGYPVESLADLPAGTYYVQAVLNVYSTFHRSDGHVIKAHMDQGEGQKWNRSPGNLISEVQQVRLDPARGETVRLSLTQRIPPIDPPQDTKYVKHVRIKSELVSKFWGTDMFVGAVVLLPEGFDAHPKARYPVAYYQDHFFATVRGFREQPPEPGLKGPDSVAQTRGYDGYREWISGRIPRMLVVMVQDPNPYFDDSYAVNSANLGPYGDALTTELIPYVEEKFRAIGQGWARTLYGGSTGGWRSLALQVFHPDMFNGTWAFCPDPIDFRYYSLVNIYQDSNAYYPNSQWKKAPIRPWMRDVDDQVIASLQQASMMEGVLATNGRSAQQFDIWQAVYGPVGKDGYPQPIWDKRTGRVDHDVAAYMREHFDLRYIMERDWARIGPKLKGKIHIPVGDMDNFFLEEAVRLTEQFLEGTKDPYYAGSVEYGERRPHCYSGAPTGVSSASTFSLPWPLTSPALRRPGQT